MNLLLFIVTIIISFVVVRIGAIAFELTGLEWSLAKFQALSCFTGTGFTTREAELITGNPQRRSIASVLMVFGNAGLVTLIATFANSLRPNFYLPKVTIPFIHLVFPSRIVPWINLAVIGSVSYAVYRFFTRSRYTRVITLYLRKKLIKKKIIKPVSFEELLVATGGYGVSSIDICKKSQLLDKPLREAKLRDKDITVLAVERGQEIIPNPPAAYVIKAGDTLICFGKLETIRKAVCPVKS